MDLPPRAKSLRIMKSHKLPPYFSIFGNRHMTLQLITEVGGRDEVFIGVR
jgi:hypothetical protein